MPMGKYLPHGTTVTFDASAIGGLISITIPNRTRGEAEITDSASGFNREYYPGLREGDTLQLTFRHNPGDAGQLKLESNFLLDGSAAIKACVIALPAGWGTPTRSYYFNGFVTQPPSGDLNLVDDAVAEQTAAIKVTGAIIISN